MHFCSFELSSPGSSFMAASIPDTYRTGLKADFKANVTHLYGMWFRNEAIRRRAVSVHRHGLAQAPVSQKIVTVSFNAAVLQTAEAQKDMGALKARFAPRQAQLQTLNDEVEALRKQLSDPTSSARRR